MVLPPLGEADRLQWPKQIVCRADFGTGTESELLHANDVGVEVSAEMLRITAPGFHPAEIFLPYPVKATAAPGVAGGGDESPMVPP